MNGNKWGARNHEHMPNSGAPAGLQMHDLELSKRYVAVHVLVFNASASSEARRERSCAGRAQGNILGYF